MAEGKKMSRRDWFRLVPRRSESETLEGDAPSEAVRAAASMGASSRGLQSIPHPENHDGMDLAELPPMSEAFLSNEQVQQLFADIETLATDILLMQIRYRWQSSHWIDTLERRDAGIRLVRITHNLASLAKRPAAMRS
jgi:hypothetical protein